MSKSFLDFCRKFHRHPAEVLSIKQKEGKKVTVYFLKKILFWRIVFTEYWYNHCITRASALAFTLLLAMIPLMASFSYMVATLIEIHPEQVQEIVTLFLPFSPPTILDHIYHFLSNATKLRGIGIVFLFVVSVGLFGAVEESLNVIWKVHRSRSFFSRLRTFTMVMIYGPLLFYASFRIRSSGWFDFISGYFFPVDMVPFLLVVLAFTVFIWLMPNTRVRLRAAFWGGVVAGTLFEMERWGFGTYIRLSIQTRTIYGAYGILPFFLVSLFLVSMFVLFGAQTAYVIQNFRPLLRSKKSRNRRIADYKLYLAFRILIDVFESFENKRKPPTLNILMKKYELTLPQAQSILDGLIHEGYVHLLSDRETYTPAYDFSGTRIEEIINKIEDECRKTTNVPDDARRRFFLKYLDEVRKVQISDSPAMTFRELVDKTRESR